MSHDAIVIGAGTFGATISKALALQGRRVLVVDAREPENGSGPSGGLMKPSWFSSMGPERYEPALALLDRVHGVRDLQFTMRPVRGFFTVHWCPTATVLAPHPQVEYRRGRVTDVRSGGIRYTSHDSGEELLAEARLVVVAAGVWCGKLLDVPGLEGKRGVAWSWVGQVSQPFIQGWAPYKQLVAFNESTTRMWVGDGSALKADGWTPERHLQSARRCAEAVGKEISLGSCRAGLRPYVPRAKPCLLEERAPGLWLATGGAKNGTIAAGWCAHEILRRTS